MKALIFDSPREEYSIDQIRRPMTVQDLRELLEDMDDDDRYTFGSLQYPVLATVNDDGEILREEELF